MNNHSSDDEDRDTPIGAGRTFQDLLYAQLSMTELEEQEQILAEYLIGNLDESGYLRRELSAIANDLAFSMNISTSAEELEEILKVIQELDPPGIGARDLRVEARDRPDLRQVQRLALRHAFDHVEQYDVAEFLLRGEQRQRPADIPGSDQCDLLASHGARHSLPVKPGKA